MDFLILRGLVVPEENLPLLRTAKRQSRALANLTGCKLNQAQMTLAIDVFGYKSWAKLKNAIELNEVPNELACLLDRDHNDVAKLITCIRSNWNDWQERFKNITYLQDIEATKIIATILNLEELEITKIVRLD